MAYTNPWDEAAPTDLTAAKTIDDLFRQLKIDIRERLDDILAAGGKFTDDPIILAPALRTGQVLLVPDTAAVMRDSSAGEFIDFSAGLGTTSGAASNTHVYIPLPLLDFWKVTKVEVLVDRLTNTIVTVEFKRVTFDTAHTVTVIDNVTFGVAGLSIATPFTGAETIASSSTYYVKLLGSNVGGDPLKIGGVRITYDEV